MTAPAAARAPSLRVLEDAAAVARAGADVLAEAVAAAPELVLALPTGRTPVPLYDELARRHRERSLDLARARGFNLDELVLARADERSFHSFMERHAWGRTGLRRERCDIPDGEAADLAAECRRYEDAIEAAGGIDLALLGVGADGHVAYNLPAVRAGSESRPAALGASRRFAALPPDGFLLCGPGQARPAALGASRRFAALPPDPQVLPTHVVVLPDGLAASLGVPAEAWPLRAITMGLGTIARARALLVLATGASKATAVRALLGGVEDPEWPCSFLGGHPRLRVLADPAAASGLR
jgi:glucosamine-6-phosphate deaminase